jgi:hypothetical protein
MASRLDWFCRSGPTQKVLLEEAKNKAQEQQVNY